MTPYERLAEDVASWVDETLATWEARPIRGHKVIRDGCAGFGLFAPHECNLIDSPLLQRLRRIHQTALAFLTYPSAVHTRFEHSLGCAILVDRMAAALGTRGYSVGPVELAHLRMAALLHDCGHLPFSHAAEPVLAQTKLYREAEAEEAAEAAAAPASAAKFFRRHKEHEILSHLIIKSEPFSRLWQQIANMYAPREVGISLHDINLDVVADMVLGKRSDPRMIYHAQMINGAMDADKLDYMQRDALFTGLCLHVDLDRLFYTMRPIPSPTGDRQLLGIELAGVANVEQLVFNKILLYSSLYHHHKVRSGLCMAQALLRRIAEDGELRRPSDFLRTDDWALLGSHPSADAADPIRDRIRRRDLPKRALVITTEESRPPSLTETDITYRSKAEGNQPSQQKKREAEDKLIESCEVPDALVFLDFPGEPSLDEAAHLPVLRNAGAGSTVVDFGEIHPTQGWVSSYSQYKHRRYVFAPENCRRKVAEAAVSVLEEELGIQVTQQALDDAKHDPPLVLL